jgi:hypothetical protein
MRPQIEMTTSEMNLWRCRSTTPIAPETSNSQPAATVQGTGMRSRVGAASPPPAQARAPSATEAVTKIAR